MEAVLFKKRLMEHLHQASGFEPHRKYLGMSGIGRCPARLYRECRVGRREQRGEDADRRCYRGNMYERDALQRAGLANLVRPDSSKALVADFDDRFRGHTDGELVDGDLLEIKSVWSETFDQVQASHKPQPFDLDQVQMYLRFGKYRHGVILYICTETFRHYAIDIYPQARRQEELIEKARMVLQGLDTGSPPACTCGRCFDFRSPAREDRHVEQG
jgi:hypothetical protein